MPKTQFEKLEPVKPLTPEQENLLSYLTQDIEDLKSKEWLATALLSHAKRSVGDLTEEQVKTFLRNNGRYTGD